MFSDFFTHRSSATCELTDKKCEFLGSWPVKWIAATVMQRIQWCISWISRTWGISFWRWRPCWRLPLNQRPLCLFGKKCESKAVSNLSSGSIPCKRERQDLRLGYQPSNVPFSVVLTSQSRSKKSWLSWLQNITESFSRYISKPGNTWKQSRLANTAAPLWCIAQHKLHYFKVFHHVPYNEAQRDRYKGIYSRSIYQKIHQKMPSRLEQYCK